MKIKRKVKSQSGLTLAETLVAVLILLLVSTIVAQGIPVAKTAYEKVVIAANAKVMLTTTITALRNELATAQRIKVNSTGTSITYYSADRGADSKIYLSSGAGADSNYKAGTIMLQEYTDYGIAGAATGDTSIPVDASIFDILQPGWEKNETAKARALTPSLEAKGGGTDKLYVTYDSIDYEEIDSDQSKYKISVEGLKVYRASDPTNPLAQFGTSSTDGILYIRVISNEAKYAESASTAS